MRSPGLRRPTTSLPPKTSNTTQPSHWTMPAPSRVTCRAWTPPRPPKILHRAAASGLPAAARSAIRGGCAEAGCASRVVCSMLHVAVATAAAATSSAPWAPAACPLAAAAINPAAQATCATTAAPAPTDVASILRWCAGCEASPVAAVGCATRVWSAWQAPARCPQRVAPSHNPAAADGSVTPDSPAKGSPASVPPWRCVVPSRNRVAPGALAMLVSSVNPGPAAHLPAACSANPAAVGAPATPGSRAMAPCASRPAVLAVPRASRAVQDLSATPASPARAAFVRRRPAAADLGRRVVLGAYVPVPSCVAPACAPWPRPAAPSAPRAVRRGQPAEQGSSVRGECA
jgi:hypothetical protein